MKTDLVINLFGADSLRALDIARVADQAGFGVLWVNDHFSGSVVGAPWSRDPFAMLGALATTTTRCDLGLLVANIANRHPAQLASATNTVESLAPGRVRLGVGSGAAPGSRFAVEHDMIGTVLEDAATRRQHLREYIAALRAIWMGAGSSTSVSSTSAHASLKNALGITDASASPSLIVGSSAWPTIEVALDVADGVNIRRTSQLAEQLERIEGYLLAHPDRSEFEISVLDDFDALDVHHLRGGDHDDLLAAGVHRRIVTVSDGVDLDALGSLGERLQAAAS